MKTDELIASLSSDVAPIDRWRVGKRFGMALLLGTATSLLLVAWVSGVRPDLVRAVTTPAFCTKVGFALSLGACALWLTSRLSKPGRSMGWAAAAVTLPLLSLWIGGVAIAAAISPAQRLEFWAGDSWWSCALNIAWLSAPSFLLMLAEVRSMAPTRLRLAGMAAGLLAGATGGLAFTLHCQEVVLASWSVWYLLGALIPAATGAVVGPRVLRW